MDAVLEISLSALAGALLAAALTSWLAFRHVAGISRLLRQRTRSAASREQLVALSTGRNYESQDRAIDLQVSRLRQKLGDAGGSDGLVKTVRNEGYVFASAVTLE